MIETRLGEFGEVILLLTRILGEEAYALKIADELSHKPNAPYPSGPFILLLPGWRKKGCFLKLVLISIVLQSPLPWHIMHNWLQNFSYRTEITWDVFRICVLSVLIALLTISYQSLRQPLLIRSTA
ncbi:MAG TPA: hypothetical protein VKQ08_00855 [Cyclobacteriaceae bacterium]|nr:hypothetical protein [Cyclobacteriaceae bacterium]